MTVRIRLTGDPGEITRLVAAVGRLAEVAGDRRRYPNRGGFGVRVYLEAQPRPTRTQGGDR